MNKAPDKNQPHIIQIRNTPLSISVYSVKDKPLNMHDDGILEIIFCLSGSVKFAYAYEEFTLNAGEYVSVDKDAYYLYSSQPNMCVSFYIDLMLFKHKYPNIQYTLFVCEGCTESTTQYPTKYHDSLRGKLIALLKVILDGDVASKAGQIESSVESIVDLFVHHFNIYFFHTGKLEAYEAILNRNEQIAAYMNQHLSEKLTLNDVAKHIGVSVGYLSEYMRKNSIGFREMLFYYRANRSEWYLINTSDTIIEISEKCGFSDPQYYYKAFKKWYRCTPKQFREKYIKQSKSNMQYHEPSTVREIVDHLLVEHYIDLFFK